MAIFLDFSLIKCYNDFNNVKIAENGYFTYKKINLNLIYVTSENIGS